MQTLMILGAGRMGLLTSYQLAQTGDYQIHLLDNRSASDKKLQTVLQNNDAIHFHPLDVTDTQALSALIDAQHCQSIVSCLPYYLNFPIIELATQKKLNYFDLTEDSESSHKVWALANQTDTALVPQCGIAPGFINTIAHHYIEKFTNPADVVLAVGALPLQTSNHLQYALNWSTEGLINEYANPCEIIEHGEIIKVPALEGLQSLIIDGRAYEMFFTSGGVGSLIHTYENKVNHLAYKTIRYPGHCAKMRFMMQDMNLAKDRKKFKKILDESLSATNHDIVLLYISVSGLKNGRLFEMSYSKQFSNTKLNGLHWSAIQMTTTTALCTAIDIVLNSDTPFQGLVKQEDLTYSMYQANRFGQYFTAKNSS